MPLNATLRSSGGAPPPPPPAPTGLLFYLWDTGTTTVLQTSQPTSTKSQSITVTAGVESYTLTDGRQANYTVTPNVSAGSLQTTDYLATVNVTATFATAWMRIALEQNGVFLAGGWGPWQAIPSNGTYTFGLSDDPNTVWDVTDKLQLFIDVRNTGTSTGTVTWEIGGPTETLATPLPSTITPPPPPPPPVGGLQFDGRATLLADLQGHEVLSTQPYTNGPITWAKSPFGTHYFYLHHTPVPHIAGEPDYHTHTCRLHGAGEIQLYDGINFLEDNISLVGDSRYGQVFKVTARIGLGSAWQGAITGGTVNGASQMTLIRPTDLGSTKWYAVAVKIPSFQNVTSIGNCELYSFGYQTSSGSQFTLALDGNGSVLTYQVHVNAGYASGNQGSATGSTSIHDFLPTAVTFGQWQEFVIGIKWATDKTGFVQIHYRPAGGTWSQVYNKTAIDTELYGPITLPGGTVKTFLQDGSNWLNVMDKMGLYYAMGGIVQTETLYNTGWVVCDNLATAKAIFPA